MSRFIVTSGSDFRPFSYDELLKPVQASAEAHAAAADAYDQLSMETAALGNYISSEEGSGDVRARAMYDNYVQKLQNFQNNLWENGVTAATRRDMSAARSAYAQDITRLQKAIQDRQERSKEYWDARHKNPDLIMGFDPRNGGLDNYLDNSEYGRDWYSYSGNQFASEVGAEAKARAAELLDSYADKSEIPGYLRYIQKQGFTNAQVNNAGILAGNILSGQGTIEDADDPATALLASVLISRMQATGAKPGENVSPDEFGRMFNYGLLGLSQGIGELNEKLIEDKVWEQRQKYNLAAYQHGLTNPGPGTDVHRESIPVAIESPKAAAAAAERASIYNTALYAGGNAVPVNLPDGNIAELHDTNEAREKLVSSNAKTFKDVTGLDVTKEASNWWGTQKSRQTGNYKGSEIAAKRATVIDWVMDGVRPGTPIVEEKVGGRWKYNPSLSDAWQRAQAEQNKYVRDIETLNPGMKVSELGLTSQEAQDIRKKNPAIPAGVADSDLIYAQRSIDPIRTDQGIAIMLNDDDDQLRSNVARKIQIFARDGKTSANGFYKVSDDNTKIDGKNVLKEKGGLANVFTMKNDTIDPSSILAAYVLPQDIKDGHVKVRIRTTKGTFITDISTFGNDLSAAFNPDMARIVERATQPVFRAQDILDQNNPLHIGWDTEIYNLFYANPYSRYQIPYIKQPDGTNIPATARQVARDPALQQALLDGIGDYLRSAVFSGIDPQLLHPYQHKGFTSSKASDNLDF